MENEIKSVNSYIDKTQKQLASLVGKKSSKESKKRILTSDFWLTKKTVAKHIKEIKNTIITGDN